MTEHEQSYNSTARIRAGGATVAAAAGIVCVLAAVASRNVVPAILGLLVAGFIAQLNVRTTVDGDALTATMWPFPAKRVPLQDITSVEVVPHQWLHGIGYRWLAPGAIGLLVGGPEVLITHGDKSLRVSANDPESLVAALKRR